MGKFNRADAVAHNPRLPLPAAALCRRNLLWA
jgi:hypothetical protein